MEIEPYKLQQMLNDAAQLAVKEYRISKGEERSQISFNKACKIYGRGFVARWVAEGLIKVKQDGGVTSPKRLNVYELELLSRTSNRSNYKTVKERHEMLSKALNQAEVNL